MDASCGCRLLSLWDTQNTTPIYLNRQSVTILYGTPRVLRVDMQCKAFSVIVVVAHFPHSCTETTKAWYAEHAEVMTKHVGGRDMFMLCDANAQIDSVNDCVSGGYGPPTTQSLLVSSFRFARGLV